MAFFVSSGVPQDVAGGKGRSAAAHDLRAHLTVLGVDEKAYGVVAVRMNHISRREMELRADQLPCTDQRLRKSRSRAGSDRVSDSHDLTSVL